jgi:shikimate kinase
MKIYLVGFMGAGKTTVGQALADRLGFSFADLDSIVERAEGRTIKEIFASAGEAYFRRLERELLVRTREWPRTVVATGGGTFTFEENIQFIRAQGLSIFLAAPFPLIAQRIREKTDARPLFRDEEVAYELYQNRSKCYRMADTTVEVKLGETVSEVVERIVIDLPRDFFAPASRSLRP